mmetsp:Transcript_12948/g.15706  ORF Transcript_12948/g.15706 Transcript_12948/m.15706 type:complete len:373 (-) Transcript_12948:853-1971(-)|eukprot:CAMPEP_0184032832 /NCGR_PEP_ID=MMETSP0955-20130417/3333_1 /TAXON_ID=627963 /ORGANISM="Aplanochytrium sp, Strain PBS07" /LENGTH=372 /DNA_ID=CAMNT_0026319025 /DNA_START=225 /DNA_END=1343 /DNA_ORIENTATION=-
MGKRKSSDSKSPGQNKASQVVNGKKSVDVASTSKPASESSTSVKKAKTRRSLFFSTSDDKGGDEKNGLRVLAEGNMFGALSTVIKQGDLTDLVLTLTDSHGNSKDTSVHRLVLAAVSEPLRKKMDGANQHTDEGKRVLLLKVESIEAFSFLLEFAYGKPVFIPASNSAMILEVLRSSCVFQVNHLRDKCIEYLIGAIETGSATTVLKAAESLNLESLSEAAAQNVADNLHKIKNMKQYFDNIPDSAFTKIFSRETLNTPRAGETAIVDLVFERTKQSKEADNARTDLLLRKCVKFVDMSDKQLLRLALDKRFNSEFRRKMIMDAVISKKFPSLIHQVAAEKGEDCSKHFKSAPYLQHRTPKPSSSYFQWLTG